MPRPARSACGAWRCSLLQITQTGPRASALGLAQGRQLRRPRLLPQRDVRLQIRHHARKLRRSPAIAHHRSPPSPAPGAFPRSIHPHRSPRPPAPSPAPGCASPSRGWDRESPAGASIRSAPGPPMMSHVLRVAVSNVRMPRSHRITSGLPCATMYSARHQQFLDRAAQPALQQHRPARTSPAPSAARSSACCARRSACMSAYSPPAHVAVAHHFGDDRRARSLPAPCAAASALPLPSPGNRRARCAA